MDDRCVCTAKIPVLGQDMISISIKNSHLNISSTITYGIRCSIPTTGVKKSGLYLVKCQHQVISLEAWLGLKKKKKAGFSGWSRWGYSIGGNRNLTREDEVTSAALNA